MGFQSQALGVQGSVRFHQAAETAKRMGMSGAVAALNSHMTDPTALTLSMETTAN